MEVYSKQPYHTMFSCLHSQQAKKSLLIPRDSSASVDSCNYVYLSCRYIVAAANEASTRENWMKPINRPILPKHGPVMITGIIEHFPSMSGGSIASDSNPLSCVRGVIYTREITEAKSKRRAVTIHFPFPLHLPPNINSELFMSSAPSLGHRRLHIRRPLAYNAFIHLCV